MSIKGIDTQIMITRLADSVREASVMQKRPEVARDVLATKEKINDAVEQSRVAKTAESEMDKVRPDVDEGGSGAYDGESGAGGRRDNWDEEPGADMIVPPGNNLIDIKI